MAGYSSRPLRDKLGIRPESRVALLQAPSGSLEQLQPLPPAVSPRTALGRGRFDFIRFFTTSHRVCAVDEVWSGLKLVVRLKDR